VIGGRSQQHSGSWLATFAVDPVRSDALGRVMRAVVSRRNLGAFFEEACAHPVIECVEIFERIRAAADARLVRYDEEQVAQSAQRARASNTPGMNSKSLRRYT
jgi:hypothetical protein